MSTKWSADNIHTHARTHTSKAINTEARVYRRAKSSCNELIEHEASGSHAGAEEEEGEEEVKRFS